LKDRFLDIKLYDECCPDDLNDLEKFKKITKDATVSILSSYLNNCTDLYNLDLVKYLIEEKKMTDLRDKLYRDAIVREDNIMIDYLKEKFVDINLYEVCRQSNSTEFKKISKNSTKSNLETCFEFCTNLEIVKHLIEEKCVDDPYICYLNAEDREDSKMMNYLTEMYSNYDYSDDDSDDDSMDIESLIITKGTI
jgi:hypothetical protein